MPLSDDSPFGPQGWRGGDFELRRLRRVKRVRVSSDYAALLADELNSKSYARRLIRSRADPVHARHGQDLICNRHGSRDSGWIAKQRGRTVKPSPEYLLLLEEEMSSREYALSVAMYAHLEELYRCPSRVPSLSRRNGQVSIRRGLARFRAGIPIALIVLALALLPAGTSYASLSAIPWIVSFVGVSALGLTAIAAKSSTLRRWIHATSYWSDDW